MTPSPAADTTHRSVLLGHGRRSTFAAGGTVRSGYIRTAAAFSLLLLLYPICWACSEGGNVISPTGEMIWYGILDLLAGPVFLFLLLFGLRSADMTTFGRGYEYGGSGNAGPGMTTAPGANGVAGTRAGGHGVGPTSMGAGRTGAGVGNGTTTGAGMGSATGNGTAAMPGGTVV